MAIEVFHGASIPRELSSSTMEFLWAKWKALHATQDLSLQRLTEEGSHELRANCTHLLTMGDDFYYLYVGENVQVASGYNATGTLMSASTNPMARDLANVYRQAVRDTAPYFVRFTGARSQKGEVWQGLALPIRLAGGAVLLVCYVELQRYQDEVLEHVFATMADGMLVAHPIANDAGKVVDGWVVMLNDAARAALDFRGGIGNLRISQLPRLDRVRLGFKLDPPVAAPTVIGLERADDLDVELIRFPRTLALRLRPVVAAPPLVPAAASELAPV